MNFSDVYDKQAARYPDAFAHAGGDPGRWIVCLCLLDFDVNVGPDFACIYPPVSLPEPTLRAVCFGSFPEHSLGASAIEAFHRFRVGGERSDPRRRRDRAREPDRTLFGYTVFQQQKDARRPRAYAQRALTLLSQHAFPLLFEACVRAVAASAAGLTAAETVLLLQSAVQQIAAWPPPPTPGTAVGLGFMGRELLVDAGADAVQAGGPSPATVVALNGHTSDWGAMARALRDLNDLYVLFERTLLGLPVGVYAETPAVCSALAAAVPELILPMIYGGEVAEYVTLQSDSRGLLERLVPGGVGACVVGFTNPLVADQAGADAPIVHATGPQRSSMRVSLPVIVLDSAVPSTNGPDYAVDLLYPLHALRRRRNRVAGRRFLARDRTFLRALGEMLTDGSPPARVDAFVRTHFAALTLRLLAPVSRYAAMVARAPR
ncbi:uncharacterized protein V1510DRAFT_371584, partial [Dipodascopsis tothii]|uniref:uncharacterized protein n=1 Tax=Dipodascopsis tothii TaxID=44089 RepID=UPI0034CF5EB3